MPGLVTTIIEFDVSHHSFKTINMDDLSVDMNDKTKIYWIHCDLNNANDIKIIASKLHLPEHVKKLCEQNDMIPKLIDDSESLAIQTECLVSNELKEEVIFGNLIFYLTSRYCFTAASEPLPPLFSFEATYAKSLKYAKTPCFILFLILDNAINDFSRLLLDFEILADQIDLEIRDTEKNIYNDVMSHKKQVMKVQHHIAAVRDLLMRISGRKIIVISEQCRLSLENLLDHSQIIFNEAEAIREILRSTLDQIDNALMQKMNNTMKVLTAFASIFLPLTLIAGIYGMNFDWMPELHWKYGYFYALFLMVFIGGFLYYFFKKMKWF
jgi:magnesium transporter